MSVLLWQSVYFILDIGHCLMPLRWTGALGLMVQECYNASLVGIFMEESLQLYNVACRMLKLVLMFLCDIGMKQCYISIKLIANDITWNFNGSLAVAPTILYCLKM
jgi:hypothetical protein